MTWEQWPLVIAPGAKPRTRDRVPRWPDPKTEPVANEGRYLQIEACTAAIFGGCVDWLSAGERYRGPLRGVTRRGYHTRITREGLAHWPTYAPMLALADVHEHPVRP